MNTHSTQISNVLIIGSGGAGLRAAIEVKLSGLAVCILGKRERNDVQKENNPTEISKLLLDDNQLVEALKIIKGLTTSKVY